MTRIRRLIPSPAMAVALVALFMAMGGSVGFIVFSILTPILQMNELVQ